MPCQLLTKLVTHNRDSDQPCYNPRFRLANFSGSQSGQTQALKAVGAKASYQDRFEIRGCNIINSVVYVAATSKPSLYCFEHLSLGVVDHL